MNEKQKPDTPGLAQDGMHPKVGYFRDVLGGTFKLRSRSTAYLPKFEAEESGDYSDRLKEAVSYNATRLTLDAMVGMVFKTDPELAADLPVELVADWENIDLGGRHGSVFARDLFRSAWDGLAVIFVDMQRTDPDKIRTLRDERGAGLRPYWVVIESSQILRARPINVDGREVLGRFAYKESVTLSDGEFGEREEVRVRDYTLDLSGAEPVVQFRIFAKESDSKTAEWAEIDDGVMSIDEIPAVPCYTGRSGFFAADPPLLDLAYENVDYYQQRSEHRIGWKYARVPVPVYPGMDPDEEVVHAANRGIITPTPDHKPYYMETSGKSLDGSKEELRESERRMAMQGASMLYTAERDPQTATAERIEKAESDSRLASSARNLNDCLEEAIRLHAKWRGVELPSRTNGRWISVSRDFASYEMSPQMVQALGQQIGVNLSLESWLIALRDGVPALSFLDPEKEVAMLAGSNMQPPALDATA